MEKSLYELLTDSTVTEEQRAALRVQAIVANMMDHCRVENSGLVLNENRTRLAKDRQEMIKAYGKDVASLLNDLRAILETWSGSKGQKQSFKRSWSKQFHVIHDTQQLSFKGDTPIIQAFDPPAERAWQDKVSDLLLEVGASQKLVDSTIRTIGKELAVAEQRREQARAQAVEDLRKEKARTVEQLKARQAELEKELQALG